MHSMTRDEIRALADQARTDLKVARGKFRKLAMENGFKGASGGWIYHQSSTAATVQGWQGLADLVWYGSVHFLATEERAAQDQRAAEAEIELSEVEPVEQPAPPAPAPKKAEPLTPAMQRLVRALETHGNVDTIRDGGTVGTVMALMDRGILREQTARHLGYGSKHHFPATTPEQVWDDAYAEYDEREATALEADGGWGQPDGMMGPTEAERAEARHNAATIDDMARQMAQRVVELRRATVQTVPIPAAPAVGAVDAVGNQLHEGDPVDAGNPDQRYGVDYIDDDGSVWVYPLGISMGKSLKVSPSEVRKMTYDGNGKLVPLEPAPAAGVTGRAAAPGTRCSSPSTCLTPAVSTFLIDGRTFGSACERHIIEVHDLAGKNAKPDVYQRGTETYRVNLTHVPVGARILVRRKMDTPLILADAKTDALIATVLGKRKGGGFRCYTLVTDLGEIVDSAARSMHALQQ